MLLELAEGIASSLHKMDGEALRTALKLTADDKEIEDKKFFEWLSEKQGVIVKEREDRGYQRAQKTILTALEKDLRSEFGIDDAELKGVDLVRGIVEKTKEEASKTGKSKLTDDEVKKHPIFLELEKAKKKEVEDLKKDYDGKLTAKDQERAYEQLLTEVDSEAEKYLSEIGDIILPDEPSIAAKHKKRLFYDELRSVKYEKLANGDKIVLNPDGTRMEDKAGNPINLKDFSISIAKQNFQFKAAKDRKTPGNGGEGGSGGGGADKKYKGEAPKTKDDYIKYLTDPSLTPEQKTEIKADFGSQFNKD